MAMNKNILVLAKLYKGDLSPFDACALECALSIEGASVTLLSMAPPQMEESLGALTRLGLDAILLSDPAYAGSDTVATARILSKAIAHLSPDLIFAGRESEDGNTAQVPLMLSELTGYALFQKAMSLSDGELTNRDGESIRLDRKQIITFEKFRLLRPPSIFSKKKAVRRIDNQTLMLPLGEVGLQGSPTRVVASYPNRDNRRSCQSVDYGALDQIIQASLAKEEASAAARPIEAKAAMIHYVGDLKEVASSYAEKAEEIDVSSCPNTASLCERIQSSGAKLILWEEAGPIKEKACQVASRLGLGLCADCTSLRYEDGRFILTRPALGGDILADIECLSPIAMATMKAPSKRNDEVAFVIGRGALPHLDKVRALAARYGAKIYCSRPLADNGEFAYEDQVGLTGISIAPKVAIAIGVSGAIQHVVGIERSGTIVAINIDKKAPIFDYADYGIVMDAENL